jgi:hypothetical protein
MHRFVTIAINTVATANMAGRVGGMRVSVTEGLGD